MDLVGKVPSAVCGIWQANRTFHTATGFYGLKILHSGLEMCFYHLFS